MIKIRDLHKRFGEQVVLAGANLDIEDGSVIAIVGPSGTGKSVLLKIITGLMLADFGEVIVGDESMTGAKNSEERRRICRQMGVLFQNAALFDSLTLFENVCFPLDVRKELKETEIKKRSMHYLREVGLRGFENALPGEVSIGMRKRVGIARALVTEPRLILFDEPNTGLDPEVGQEIYELISETHKKFGFTGIVISHEIPEVFQVCSRVAMLYGGQIQAEGTIDEFLASNNQVVKQFVAGNIQGPIQLC
ncbi:MAG: ATP-binding cassette domain-containing protein [Deltaproteobacteria bacterium]|nr:ATP-binding cassette domain-containing protein [Deltaproteobacteria bacterium]